MLGKDIVHDIKTFGFPSIKNTKHLPFIASNEHNSNEEFNLNTYKNNVMTNVDSHIENIADIDSHTESISDVDLHMETRTNDKIPENSLFQIKNPTNWKEGDTIEVN